MEKFDHPLLTFMLKRDPIPLVVSTAVLMLVWGLAIGLSEPFFDIPIYRMLQTLGDGHEVGLAFTLFALFQFFFLYLKSYRWLRHSSLVATLIWEALAAGVAAGGGITPAAPLYVVFGFMTLWAYLLLGVNGYGSRQPNVA